MKNTFLVALRAILVNKSRSFLTMLGVIIGVASVVLLTSIGSGLQAYVTEQFEDLGSNNIIITPGDMMGEEGGFDRNSQVNAFANNKLRSSHVQKIRQLDSIKTAIPFNTQSEEIKFLQETKSISVVGTYYEYPEALNTKIEKGQFFDKADDQGAKKVAVLGYQVAEDVFKGVDPVGKKIKLGTQTFTVIGVAEKKGGGMGGPSFDTYVYIPLKTFEKIYDNEKVLEIIARANSKEEIPSAIKEVERVLLKEMEDDDFSVMDQSELLSSINQILGVLTAGLGGIAAISLVVGGIGIMNIMLVSVTERTREIGLRKALGATPNQILQQFLIEAALLSVIGGLIGLGIAYLGSLALQAVFPAKVTLEAIMLAFGVSTVVGLVFGAAPARRAANLSPIEALRYE